MREIELGEAQASLSSVIDRARQGQPSIIVRFERPEAVVLSFEEWQRLSQVPTFDQLLMAAPLEDGDVPECQSGVRDPKL